MTSWRLILRSSQPKRLGLGSLARPRPLVHPLPRRRSQLSLTQLPLLKLLNLESLLRLAGVREETEQHSRGQVEEDRAWTLCFE